jgi:hypothetical protein
MQFRLLRYCTTLHTLKIALLGSIDLRSPTALKRLGNPPAGAKGLHDDRCSHRTRRKREPTAVRRTHAPSVVNRVNPHRVWAAPDVRSHCS